MISLFPLIPANAGIQIANTVVWNSRHAVSAISTESLIWIPAFAGMSGGSQ